MENEKQNVKFSANNSYNVRLVCFVFRVILLLYLVMLVSVLNLFFGVSYLISF